MLKTIVNILNFLHQYGWLGVYSVLFRVYFAQDCDFTNGGYDILTLRRPSDFYFYGTWAEKERSIL